MDAPRRERSDLVSLAVERAVGWLRLAVVLSGVVIFPLVADRPGTPVALGYTLIALGAIYAIGVLVFEPYRRYPVLMSAWLTVPTDIVFSLVWIAITGGIDSPWIAALYAATITPSLRYRPRDAVVTGWLAAVGYIVMLALLGQLAAHAVNAAVIAFFLLISAAGCAVIARERLGQLASRLALLDQTQEVAQVGSWEWTISDNALAWSPELRRIFGLDADAQPSVEAYFAAIHPDDLAHVQGQIDATVARATPMRFEHRIVRPDGTIRWLHCRGRVVLGKDGTPCQVVGSSQDITDAHELQEQLLIGRKLASLGTLASGIAHEINNPLAYVAASLAVVQRRVDGEQVRQALDAAQDGCRRIAEIVRGLRVFSHAEDDAMTVVDLRSVTDAALAMAAHEIGQRARVVREFRDAPPVLASESRLLQVVLNLVVNAAQSIEAGAPGAHEIRVRIQATPDGRARLEVTDTGHGIPADHLPRVFDPFFTTKRPGVGTGLGLSICHGIVRDLGGEITVTSEVGRGTTFTVMLPPAPATARAASPAAAAGARRRLRVLVIAPEAQDGTALRALLGDHEVTVVPDGGRGLSLLCAGEEFDVVLCDLMMPGMTGLDLHAAVTAVRPSVVPRLVFLTDAEIPKRARALLDDPKVRTITRPVDASRLARALRPRTQPPVEP